MKIDSMDASSMALQKPQETNANKMPDNTHSESVTRVAAENANLTHLSQYEKNELPISEKVVIDAIEKANKAIMGANTKFEFSIHEKTKQIMVKVVDSDTHEVIREIPPEKILDMVAKMWEMAGIIVDERG